jgi:hypothetical protein
MRSILVLLEDLVHAEFGPKDLAAVKERAAARLHDPGRLPGAAGRVMAFVEAIADVRRRPAQEAYQFVGFRLVPPVLAEFEEVLKGHTTTRAVFMQLSRIAPQVLDVLMPGIGDGELDVELLDLESLRVRFEGPIEMVAVFEGAAVALGQHYGERVEVRRVSPPAFAPERRLLDIKVAGERRVTPEGQPPYGDELRRRLKI